MLNFELGNRNTDSYKIANSDSDYRYLLMSSVQCPVSSVQIFHKTNQFLLPYIFHHHPEFAHHHRRGAPEVTAGEVEAGGAEIAVGGDERFFGVG